MSIFLLARKSGDDKDTAKAVNSLLHLEEENTEKENTNLRSELSQCLAQCKPESQESQEKHSQVKQSLKASQSLVHKLQKKSDHAAKKQQHAVTRAREQAYKEKSVHQLLHKGVYTEETRNLICLLVKAGCSRAYVGKVISAVLKSAGITTIGNIS
jgi:FtsZ-interacting cell division protein ZipA